MRRPRFVSVFLHCLAIATAGLSVAFAQDMAADTAEWMKDPIKYAEKMRKENAELMESIRGQELKVKSGGEERVCRFSHDVEGGARAFFCEGKPGWMLSAAITWEGGPLSWALVGADPKNKAPRRLQIKEVYQGSKLIHATNPSGMLMDHAAPTQKSLAHFPEFEREGILLNEGLSALSRPYVDDGQGKRSFYFLPAKQGEKPNPALLQMDSELRDAAEAKRKQLKKIQNPSQLKVRTGDGRELECSRGKAIHNEFTFPGGDKMEMACELFACEGVDAAGRRFETLLHFMSDPQRQLFGMGPGSGGPYLFAGDDLIVHSLSISSISTADGTLYSPPKEATPNPFSAPAFSHPVDFSQLAKPHREGSATELQTPSYLRVLETFAKNCEGIEPAWGKIQSYYKRLEKQAAVLLVEKVAGMLSSRLIAPENLEGEVCHLEGDTYVRTEALPILPPRLLEKSAVEPISEEEAQKLFLEVEAMKDIPHDFTSSGCEARAHIVAERLKKKGIPVRKIWAQGGNLSPYKGMDDFWSFHVASAVPVKTPGGNVEWRVLDPSLANRAVDPKEWLRRFRPVEGVPSVWTKWPVPMTPGQAFTKTVINLSPPEVYLPGEAKDPDPTALAAYEDIAWKTVAGMKQSMDSLKANPDVLSGVPEMKPLVNRED